MGHYLDGRVNCVYGTHTHVQTADEKILEKGTAYITDIGMTGPKDSVIGADKHVVMSIFATEIPDHMPVAGGEVQFNGVIITIDDTNNKTTSIERINL
jgi:calcineurin-like phosphoesterase